MELAFRIPKVLLRTATPYGQVLTYGISPSESAQMFTLKGEAYKLSAEIIWGGSGTATGGGAGCWAMALLPIHQLFTKSIIAPDGTKYALFSDAMPAQVTTGTILLILGIILACISFASLYICFRRPF